MCHRRTSLPVTAVEKPWIWHATPSCRQLAFRVLIRSRMQDRPAQTGIISEGLYATGWFRRGPRGTIPENRADSQKVAARIAEDLTAA